MGRKRKGKIRSTSATPSSDNRTVIERKGTDFKVVYDYIAHRKITYFVDKSNHEVSGFANVSYDADTQTFRVHDAYLILQDNGPTSSEIVSTRQEGDHADAVTMGKAEYLNRSEVMPEGVFGMKLHWHSHVNMGVFWSGDDMKLIRSLGQNGWILASVFNKGGDVKTACLYSTEVFGKPHDLFVDDIKTYFAEQPLPEELVKAWDTELEVNVRPKKTYTTTYTGTGYVGGHRNYEHRTAEWYVGKEWCEKTREWVPGAEALTLVMGRGYMKKVDYDKEIAAKVRGNAPPSESEWPSEWDGQGEMLPGLAGAIVNQAYQRRAFLPNEYTSHGYVELDSEDPMRDHFSGWLYNPLHDKEINDDDELALAIADLTPDELEYLKDVDPKFRSEISRLRVKYDQAVKDLNNLKAELFTEA